MTWRSSHPTIIDVAREAGVSISTVSRVLSGVNTPRPDTVSRVMNAVKDVGYRPSRVAQSLRTRRTKNLGLIVTDIRDPFFPDLVQAADVTARSLGYSILLGSAAYDEHRTMHYLNIMSDARVDGILVASSQISGNSLQWLMSPPVPVVLANAERRDSPVTVITSDNQAGGSLAVRHLVELGHRKIAFIRGPEFYSAEIPRLQGFRQAAKRLGLSSEDTPVFPGNGQVSGGELGAAQLLRERPDVTALVCYNDLTAIGALRTLRAAGWRIPTDISIVGFDDIEAASWTRPALTTVGQQKTEMGRLGIERLVALISQLEVDPDFVLVPELVRLPMSLIVRGSSGKPRSWARVSGEGAMGGKSGPSPTDRPLRRRAVIHSAKRTPATE
jgi:DNA-binding LacI/PurR family transcriptional regulator